MQHRSGKRGGRGRASFGVDRGPKSKKGYLHEDTMSYYRRISDSLKQFESEGQQIDPNFLNTTFSNLAEEVVQVSQNQTVSIIIESLIAAASPSNLRTLYVAAVSDLSVAFLDRFASHVFERLVQSLPHFFHRPAHDSADDEEEDVAQEKFLESFEMMCQFVDSHFETLATHTYGSHVLRALLEALSGVSVVHELKKSQKSGHSRHSKEIPTPAPKVKLPEQFRELFDTYAERLFHICDYEVHLKDPFFSLLMQAVLMIRHKVDTSLCQTHCRNILQQVQRFCPQSDNPAECLPDVAQDVVGSHLLEVIFKLSSPELHQHVFESLLQGKLLYYAIHPVANYVLQSFISNLKEKDVMEKLFDELFEHLEDVLAVGYFSLVTCLAEACRRLHLKQDDFIMSLMGAFHCREPEDRQNSLVKLIASLTAYEVFFALEEGAETPAEGAKEATLKGPFKIHGSLLLQQLLQFQKPKHAAVGIVSLTPEELKVLCCDPSGSRVIDVFFSSPSVLEKNKDIFLKKMKGLLVDVACSKNGSRCLESVWKHLSLKQRTRVAEELVKSDRLHSDRFGHFLVSNFRLSLFSSRHESWLEQQGADTKRKRMMKELLHSIEPPGKKKKKAEDEDINLQADEDQEDHVTSMFLNLKKEKRTKVQATAQPQDGSSVKKHSTDDSSTTASAAPEESAEDRDTARRKKKKAKKDKVKKATRVSPEPESKDPAMDCDSGEGENTSKDRHCGSGEEKSPKKGKEGKKKAKKRQQRVKWRGEEP